MRPTTPKGNLLDRRFLLKSAGAFVGYSSILKNIPMTPNEQQSARSPQNLRTRNSIGFMLAHEQFSMPQLVEFGAAAEQAGFDFVANSDHIQPWQANEAHAGMSWLTMSALGQKTAH